MSIFSRFKLTKHEPTAVIDRVKDYANRPADSQATQEDRIKSVVVADNVRAPVKTGPTDDEVLAALPKGYWTEDFDVICHTLENLSTTVTAEYLDEVLSEREKAISIITTRLHRKVMNNHTSLLTGMTRVREFSDDLNAALELSKTGRTNLTQAQLNSAERAFRIMGYTRRRFLLMSMARRVAGLSTLLESKKQLDDAVTAADFPLAVEVCRRCRFETERSRNFKAAEQLMNRYEEMFATIELQLKAALASLINNFDPVKYESAIVALQMLDKINTIHRVNHEAFVDMVGNKSMSTLTQAVASVLLQKRGSLSLGSIADKSAAAVAGLRAEKIQQQKAPFKDLTMKLNELTYLPCLTNILADYFDIMTFNVDLAQWLTEKADAVTTSPINKLSLVSLFLETRAGLENGRRALWDEMQRKLSAFLTAKTMDNFHVDTVLRVFAQLNKAIRIGDVFANSTSTILRAAIRSQISIFLKTFHRKKLEEMSTLVEIETWQQCQLEGGFSIHNFKEPEFAKDMFSPEESQGSDMVSPMAAMGASFSSSSHPRSHAAIMERFCEFKKEGNAFAALVQPEQPSVEGKPAEVKPAAVKPAEGMSTSCQTPPPLTQTLDVSNGKGIATSAVMKMARMIAKYIVIMDLVRPAVPDAATNITQLVDFYTRVVKLYFGRDQQKDRLAAISNIANATPAIDLVSEEPVPEKLTALFDRLKQEYPEANPEARKIGETIDATKKVWSIPPANETVRRSLNSSGTLYGLVERVMAAESLLCLGNLLQPIKDDLENRVAPPHSAAVVQLYNQTVGCFPDMRRQIYRRLARRFINFDPILQAMGEVKWDITEIPIENSKYINTLLTEFKALAQRLSAVSGVMVPKEAINTIWDSLIRMTMYILVEGMSRAKKCSTEGRALMQLDLKVLQSGLEKLTFIRPIPHTEHAQTYINAYYLTEADSEAWFRAHKEYTPKQLTSLVNVVQVLAKSKKKLTAVIEDAQKTSGTLPKA